MVESSLVWLALRENRERADHLPVPHLQDDHDLLALALLHVRMMHLARLFVET